MTSPPRPVTVRCPRCSTVFETFYRASINLSLGEEWSEEEIEEASTAKCPMCATVTALDAIVVEGDAWTVPG